MYNFQDSIQIRFTFYNKTLHLKILAQNKCLVHTLGDEQTNKMLFGNVNGYTAPLFVKLETKNIPSNKAWLSPIHFGWAVRERESERERLWTWIIRGGYNRSVQKKKIKMNQPLYGDEQSHTTREQRTHVTGCVWVYRRSIHSNRKKATQTYNQSTNEPSGNHWTNDRHISIYTMLRHAGNKQFNTLLEHN